MEYCHGHKCRLMNDNNFTGGSNGTIGRSTTFIMSEDRHESRLTVPEGNVNPPYI